MRLTHALVPGLARDSPFPAGRRRRFTPGLEHTGSVGYGGSTTGTPKQPPSTQEKTDRDMPLPPTGPRRGRRSCRVSSLEIPKFPFFNATRLRERANTEPAYRAHTDRTPHSLPLNYPSRGTPPSPAFLGCRTELRCLFLGRGSSANQAATGKAPARSVTVTRAAFAFWIQDPVPAEPPVVPLAKGFNSSPGSGRLRNVLLVAVGFVPKGWSPSKGHSTLSPSSSLHPVHKVLIAGLEDHKTLNTSRVPVP